MTMEKICLLLKTMQYIIVIAHKKAICDDICPMRCNYRPVYGGGGHVPNHGHHVPNHGHGHGHGYGHMYQPPNDINVDIESLARAMGLPKDTFTDFVFNTSSDMPMDDKPMKTRNEKKKKKGVRPPIEKEAVQFMDTDYDETFRFAYTEDRCTSPDGRRGACLNIRRCEPLLDMLRNLRSNPGALSYLRESVCGYDGQDPIVCCPDGGNDFQQTPPPQPQYTLPTLDDNCGFNNVTFLKRVVNGVPAQLGSWPWIGALGYRSRRNPGKTLWQCGGTLITRRHVITAAHCIHGHEDDLYIVRLGELDLDRDDDGATPIDVGIEIQLKHEEYNSKDYTNDIGILKLVEDVTLTQLIWPICLPTTPDMRTESFERKLPFIAGWGALSFQGPTATHLQQLQIPVVGNDECKEAYTRFKSQVIDQRVLCAGYARGGRDACQGDSGGPLMFPQFPAGRDNLHYYLIGIVSYGFKCAEPGFPGVYTRITEFLPWIESHLNV